MPGSMSGEEKRSDGPLGERGNERPRAHSAPPALHATALLLDSTERVGTRPIGTRRINNLERPNGRSVIGLDSEKGLIARMLA